MSAGRVWDQAAFCLSEAHTQGTRFHCALCGAHFTHGSRMCGACPLSSGCQLVRCPSCGYQFPRGSSIVDAVRRLWSVWRRG